MAVAYFLRHAGTGEKFYPIINRGELAVLYCFLLLFMAVAGSGMWSLDALRRRRSITHHGRQTNDRATIGDPSPIVETRSGDAARIEDTRRDDAVLIEDARIEDARGDDAARLEGATSRPLPGRLTVPVFTVLRVMAGLLFAMHGSQKLVGWPGHQPPMATLQMRLAGTIELAGGIMIALGFVAAVAAFFASGLMAAAYFMAHAPKGLFLPILNGGELAVLYCFLWLYLAAAGPGRWSIDALRGRAGTPGDTAGEPPLRA
jgi:putative oxidoreductase